MTEAERIAELEESVRKLEAKNRELREEKRRAREEADDLRRRMPVLLLVECADMGAALAMVEKLRRNDFEASRG